MITSDKQYADAREQLAILIESFSSPVKKDIPESIEKAGKTQLQELVNEIQLTMDEYDMLKQCEPSDIKGSMSIIGTCPKARLCPDLWGIVSGIHQIVEIY